MNGDYESLFFDKVTKKCKKVIIIALDGIGLFFKKTNTPNLDKFFALGASSLNVKTIMPSDSAEFNITVASFAAWEPFNNLIKETIPAHVYAPMKNESELHKCELNSRYNNKNSCFHKDVVNKVNKFIRGCESNETKFLSIHLTNCDECGHNYGYGTNHYLQQIQYLDKQIGIIMCVIKEKGWIEDSLVIMTTDHDGLNKTNDDGNTYDVHGGNSEDEMNVFLSACGSGILAASKIKENLSNLVCAPIALSALGIENCLFASPQVEDKLDQWLTLLPDEEIELEMINNFYMISIGLLC
ncbi:12291_t:CDS:2 [Cetraspora pellucida]|uniref:12291_t:CDS:1 n=1 Tax=Cetraspora pellucida TaxID=1433469 RepID=A0ACA9L6J8_9GLOM|nr:12291_t:CDS:2 [Cetraspora pellucida]